MTLDDMWTRGLVAGLVAGIGQTLLSWGLKATHLTGLTWSGFVSILLNGHRTVTGYEAVFSELALYLWLATLGSVFAMLLKAIGGRNVRLKGAVYGALCWFLCYAAMALFHVPEVANVFVKTAASTGIVGLLWGIATADIYARLTRRYAQADGHEVSQPDPTLPEHTSVH